MSESAWFAPADAVAVRTAPLVVAAATIADPEEPVKQEAPNEAAAEPAAAKPPSAEPVAAEPPSAELAASAAPEPTEAAEEAKGAAAEEAEAADDSAPLEIIRAASGSRKDLLSMIQQNAEAAARSSSDAPAATPDPAIDPDDDLLQQVHVVLQAADAAEEDDDPAKWQPPAPRSLLSRSPKRTAPPSPRKGGVTDEASYTSLRNQTIKRIRTLLQATGGVFTDDVIPPREVPPLASAVAQLRTMHENKREDVFARGGLQGKRLAIRKWYEAAVSDSPP